MNVAIYERYADVFPEKIDRIFLSETVIIHTDDSKFSTLRRFGDPNYKHSCSYGCSLTVYYIHLHCLIQYHQHVCLKPALKNALNYLWHCLNFPGDLEQSEMRQSGIKIRHAINRHLHSHSCRD